MGKIIRYGDLSFDDTFVLARRGDQELRFTRQERALLVFFTRRPRKLLTRQQLLAALADTGNGESSERNVDYLVNRLRAKLGDRAREPAFIATQYGEGYVWVAERAGSVPDDAFMIIGPVFGMDGLSDPPVSQAFLKRLSAACRRRAAPDRPVVLAAHWCPGDPEGGKARFHVEIGFHERDGVVHVALLLRSRQPQRILHTARIVLGTGDGVAVSNGLAEELRTRMWAHLAEATEAAAALTDEPLELRVHTAGLLLGRSAESWMESGGQIAQSRAASPGDPRPDLMWASHLSTRLTLSGFRLTAGERTAIEDEIEAIALAALPRIDGDPILSLAAAQLLLGVDRGHFELAEHLAEEAFEGSVAFAASFALLGQLRMFRGEIEEALHFYDRGIELAVEDSEFRIFLLILKCSALAASARRGMLDQALALVYAMEPPEKLRIGLLFAPDLPQTLQPEEAALLEGGGAHMGRSVLTYLHHISARHFRKEAHRTNLLRGPTGQIVARFGADAVPAEVWAAAPGLNPGTPAAAR